MYEHGWVESALHNSKLDPHTKRACAAWLIASGGTSTESVMMLQTCCELRSLSVRHKYIHALLTQKELLISHIVLDLYGAGLHCVETLKMRAGMESGVTWT